MSANNPTYTVEFQDQPPLTTGFSTQYLDSRVARVTLSLSVNGQQPVQRPLEIEVGQEFPIGLEWLRGTLSMSEQAEISFTGLIQTEFGKFSINNAIIAVNSGS